MVYIQEAGNWNISGSCYVDYTAWPTPNLTDYCRKTRLKTYVLGFVTASGDGQPAWGGFNSITENYHGNSRKCNSSVAISDYGKNDIACLRNLGGDVVISFGGSANNPIEAVMYDDHQIAQIYINIVNNYQIEYIDFDFEGAFLGNTDSLKRNISAIKKVLQVYPSLGVSYTLPIDGSPYLMGLSNQGEQFLRMLFENGIVPSLINGMAMEFGSNSDSNLFNCVVNSIEGNSYSGRHEQRGLHEQIKEIYGNIWNDHQIYQHIGICNMFGYHNNGKVFTLQNQSDLVSYASRKHIKSLSGWDATRDMHGSRGAVYQSTNIDQSPGDFQRIIARFQN